MEQSSESSLDLDSLKLKAENLNLASNVNELSNESENKTSENQNEEFQNDDNLFKSIEIPNEQELANYNQNNDNSTSTKNNQNENDKEMNENSTNQIISNLNDENSEKALTESTVKIDTDSENLKLIESTINVANDQNNHTLNVELSQSTVKIDTDSDNLKLIESTINVANDQNNHTLNVELSQSTVHVSSNLNGEDDNLVQKETEKSDNNDNQYQRHLITESTLVISSSLIPEELTNSSYVDVNVEPEQLKKDSLLLSSCSEESKSSSDPSSPNNSKDEEFNTQEGTQAITTEEIMTHLANSITQLELETAVAEVEAEATAAAVLAEQEQVDKQQKEKEDDENLVKSYEIPNFNSQNEMLSSQELNQQDTVVVVEDKKQKNVNEETYLKLLGNDSLMKKIIQYGDDNGEGDENLRPRNGQLVTISYDAYLKTDNKLVDHNDNFSFILGDGDVISGLDMVVSLMSKNEKSEMIVEARHAYGAKGKEPDVPSNATLVYQIVLKDYNNVTELNEMGAVERLSMAEAKKLRGNYHFNRQDFYLAITSYKKGLKYFDEQNLRGDEEEKDLTKYRELSQAILMNLALSFFKMAEYRDALNALDQVLAVQSKHIKALYIKGKVLLLLGETQEAINALNMSLQLDPNNAEVKKELAKAQAKHKIQYQNEKKLYQKMISGVVENKEEPSSPNNSKRQNSASKKESLYTKLISVGIAMALVSVGVALYAKYRN